MDIVLPIVVLTSIFFLAVASAYDLYLRKNFVYFKKNSFDDLFISKAELEPQERKEKAETVRSNEGVDFLKAIEDIQPMVVLSMQGEILRANDHYRKLLGLTANDLVKRNHKTLVDASHSAAGQYTKLWEKLRLGKAQKGEFKLMGMHGGAVWVEATFVPIADQQSKPYQVICLVNDITDRKQAIHIIGEQLQTLAKGDLDSIPRLELEKEYQTIADTVNTHVNRLRTLLSEITDSSKYVFTSAKEMSQSNDDLCHRTRAQAISVEIIAAAIDGFTQGVKDYKVEVKATSEKTRNVIEKLHEGEGSLADNLVNMEAINSSSEKVTDVLALLDEVAFQSNVVALNAAIEAARAGESGKAFASVANEVRELASQSAQAVNEIKALIKNSRHAVHEGVKMMGRTSKQFEEISSVIQEIAARVYQIDTICQQQATSVCDVLRPVSLLNDITQKNAALVEMASTHTRNIAEQSFMLADQVTYFHTGRSSNGTALQNNGKIREFYVVGESKDKAQSDNQLCRRH